MKTLRTSLAWRLVLWFLLLSFLPIGVMILFVRRSATQAFSDLASQEIQSQARLLAAAIPDAVTDQTLNDLLQYSSDDKHQAYILSNDGHLVASSDAGADISIDFAEEALQAILGGESGVIIDEESGRLIGYSAMPDDGLFALVASDESVISAPMLEIERASSVQLAVSMIIVSVVGGVAIWIIIGPIRQLTQAAVRVGKGDLEAEVSLEDMEGELEVLTKAFNQMVSQLRQSYTELERRVAARTKELSSLNTIANVVSQSFELNEIMNDALTEVLSVLEYPAGAIFLTDPDTGNLDMTVHQGLSEAFRKIVQERLVSEKLTDTEGLLIIDDLLTSETVPKNITEDGFCCLTSVPLQSKDRVHGILMIASKESEPLGDVKASLLQSIGNQIGVAIDNARLFASEQMRAEQFRVMSEVGRSITSILEAKELLSEIVTLIQAAFEYHHVAIGVVEGNELVFEYAAGSTADATHFIPTRLQIGGEGISGWVAKTGQPLIVPDVSREPKYVHRPGAGTKSELAVPIKVKGQVIGVLNIESAELADFDDNDLTLVQSLANQAGIALENAGLFQSEQKRADQFRLISEVGRSITSILNVDDLLSEIVDLVHGAFDYHHVAIGLIEGNELVYKVGAGELTEAGIEFNPVRMKVGKEGLTGWVAGTGESVMVGDVSIDERYVNMVGSSTKSELIVPIKAKGDVIGILDVQSDQLNAFNESDLLIMQSLANQAGIALENARLYEEARQYAVLEERQRIARDLHDSVTQEIYGVTMFAEAASRMLSEGQPAEAQEHLKELRLTAQEALGEMRLLIYELRPPVLQRVGLEGALRARLEAVEGRSGIETGIEVIGEEDLKVHAQEGLYRIAREALNNALKHAHAKRLQVNITYEGSNVTIEIADDGVGFNPSSLDEEGGMGIRGMRERAEELDASIAIDSEHGRGTRIKIEWSDDSHD
jgi:nitrate/nitrite-specific signal transduction histidine kinase